MATSRLGLALISGSLAAVAVTLVASLAGRRATGSSAAALNATSHFLWGDSDAARRNAYSLKYTGVGFAANYGASIFWALLYEVLGSRRRTPARALRDAAATAAIAYIVDYHAVPKRLTPGFELRVPPRALAAVYAALALGLSLKDLYGELRK
jgi:hypothetical protein